MVGTRWNKVGTGEGALGLTTLTTLSLHKWQNLDSRGPKTGPMVQWSYGMVDESSGFGHSVLLGEGGGGMDQCQHLTNNDFSHHRVIRP